MKTQTPNNKRPTDKHSAVNPKWTGLIKLLYVGVGLKRWLLLGSFGIGLCSIGAAYLMRKWFELTFPNFLPSFYEGVLLVGMGIAVIVMAIYALYTSIGPLILAPNTLDSLANTIYTRRSRSRGPRIVVIGGGTGLSVLLRGIKSYTDNLTAIISVADDGGSSGRLRRELSVLPPGDFRNCLVALSDEESMLADLFQYRFEEGDGLKGHSFGNLFIAAMNNVTQSFEQALHESSKVLAVRGQIIPATVANLSLTAWLNDGSKVQGESAITERGGEIDRLFIEPAHADAYPPALEAIEQAQLIILGPGSLYTSIIPNLLVNDLAQALKNADATKIYVCNVATQKGETEGYSISDHIEALQRHTFPDIANYIVGNSNLHELGSRFSGEPVTEIGNTIDHAILKQADLIDPEHPTRHDSNKLAKMIMDVYHKGAGNRQT